MLMWKTLNLNIHFLSCCCGINTWTVPSWAAVVGLFSKNNLKYLIDMNTLMVNSRGKTAWAMYEAYAKETNQAMTLLLFSFLSFFWAYSSKIHDMIEIVFFFLGLEVHNQQDHFMRNTKVINDWLLHHKSQRHNAGNFCSVFSVSGFCGRCRGGETSVTHCKPEDHLFLVLCYADFGMLS